MHPNFAPNLWPATSRLRPLPDALLRLSARWPALANAPIWTCARTLAETMEAEGKRQEIEGGELPYHNREHVCDVLMALETLAEHECPALPVEDIALLAFTLLAHDYGHDGTQNRFRRELETRTLALIAPHLVGLDAKLRRSVQHLILSTDPSSYGRLARALTTRSQRLARLVVDADLLASLLPLRGFYLGNRLADELAPHQPQLAARLRTLDGRHTFLNNCAAHSIAAQHMGLDRVIRAQITTIEAMSAADRERAWSHDWGQHFQRCVDAQMSN